MLNRGLLGSGPRQTALRAAAGALLVTAALLLLFLLPAVAQASETAVSGVTLASPNPGELVITWDAPSRAPTDYRVMWAPSSGKFLSYKKENTDKAGNAYPTGTTHTVTGLPGGEEYKVRVRARNGDQKAGPWSDLVKLTVSAHPPPEKGEDGSNQPRSTNPPAKPTGLLTGVSHDSVLLSWTNPDDDTITGYQVLRGPNAASLAVLTSVTGAVTSYSDNTVEPQTKYAYAIRARNANGLSEPSNPVTVRTPAAPVGPEIALATATGQPEIVGSLQVGAILSVDTSNIMDTDGLTSPSYAYQWIRIDTDSTETDIGTDSPTYMLTDDDIGHTIKVKVSFQDDSNNPEMVMSAATAEVVAASLKGRTLWSADLTVGISQNRYGYLFDQAMSAVAMGTLEPSAIDVPRENIRAVFALFYSGNTLYFDASRAFGDGKFVLELGQHSFVLGEWSDQVVLLCSCVGYTLENHGLSWTDAQTITVRLAKYLPPDEPGNLTATSGDGEVQLGWSAPLSDEPITKFQYRVKAQGAGSWSPDWSDVPDSGDSDPSNETGYTVTSLENGIAYIFQVRAVSSLGAGKRARITASPATSSDAGLRELDIVRNEDAFTLAPSPFESSTLEYTVSIPHAVTTVTVRTATRHTNAAVVFLSAGGTTLTPANIADGLSLPLSVGDNVIQIRVTAADGATMQTYRLTLSRAAASTDALLRDLVLSDEANEFGLTPPFQSEVETYSVSVHNAVRTITVTPTTNSDLASFEYLDGSDNPLDDADNDPSNGFQLDLPIGATTVKVKVTAEDPASTKTYAVTVSRPASSVATLREIVLRDSSDTIIPVTQSLARTYTASVGPTSFTVTVSAPPTDDEASVAYFDDSDDPLVDADGDPANGHQVTLDRVVNIIKLKVTASDGTTTAIYTLTVSIELLSTNAMLRGLSLSEGSTGGALVAISPMFDRSRLMYTAWVANSVATVSVVGTAVEDLASVAYLAEDDSPLTDADAAAGHQVTLQPGKNVIKVRVTAPNNVAMAIYTVTITRRTSDPAQDTDPLTLVSNAGQEYEGDGLIIVGSFGEKDLETYQSFVTGDNAAGYVLDSIQIAIAEAATSINSLVQILEDDSNVPGDVKYTLTNPASLNTADDQVFQDFQAPENATLDKNTTYWLAMGSDATPGSGDVFKIGATDSNGEDTGHAPGWSIGNSRYFTSTDTNDNSVTDGTLAVTARVSILGQPISSDARLRLLDVSHSGGGVTLTPSPFDAEELIYAGTVTSDVETVTVGGVVNHAGASIAYLDELDAAMTDADGNADNGFQANLVEGLNTVRMKITAEDEETIRTYELRITRIAAPPSVTLVTNKSQTVEIIFPVRLGDPNDSYARAQGFTTGPNSTGYSLESLTLFMGLLTDVDVPSVTLYDNRNTSPIGHSSADQPGSELFAFANPELPASTQGGLAARNFTAPADTNLDPDTTYWIVVHQAGDEGYFEVSITLSVADDPGAAPGWFIRDSSLHRPNKASQQFQTAGRVYALRIALTGSITPGTDATLTSLSADDHLGSPVRLTPSTFDKATLDYTASVAHSVPHLTISWAVNDPQSVATVQDSEGRVLADVDEDLTNGYQVRLSDGLNTIEIRVTAEDGTTMKTYTLEVTRRNPAVDATLSSLSLTDADSTEIGLTPAFTPSRTSFTASVGNDVDMVTVTSETNDQYAQSQYLDGTDQLLTDDGSDDGFQVQLETGQTTIKVKVTAEDGTTAEFYTIVVQRAVSGLPGEPENFAANPRNQAAALSWSPPSNPGMSAIIKYRYRVSDDGGSTWAPDWTDVPDNDADSDLSDETGYTVTNLFNGTEYIIEVLAVNGTGEGPPARAAAMPGSGPAKVTGVTATPMARLLEVSWGRALAATGFRAATGYKVQWKQAGQDFSPDREEVINGGSKTSAELRLPVGVQFSVRVAGFTDDGDGEPSDEVSVTLAAPGPIDMKGVELWSAELDVGVSAEGNRGFISTALSGFAQGEIDPGHFAISRGSLQQIIFALFYRDNTLYFDPARTLGEGHFVLDLDEFRFVLGAWSAMELSSICGCKGYSLTGHGLSWIQDDRVKVRLARFSPPSEPLTFEARPANQEVTLTWTPPASDGGPAITKYQYRVSADGGTNWSPDWTDVPDGSDSGSDQADERSFTATGLANSTQYTFQVRAVNTLGEGAVAETTATPMPTPTLTLTLDTIAGDDTVNIQEKADGFVITGNTGTVEGASVTVTVDIQALTATSDSSGAWSVSVPADASYITGASVTVTVNATGTGYNPATEVTATLTIDLVKPSLSSASVSAAAITLTYTEDLDSSSTPPGTAFTVEVDGSAAALASSNPVSVSGPKVALSLDSAVSPGDTVTLDYTIPTGAGASPVRDAAGNPADSLTDQAVPNSPGAPASLTASPGDTQVELAWTPPASDGGSSVTKYQYRYKSSGEFPDSWSDIPDGSDAGSDQADERSFTVTGLDNGALHTFQVRAVNSVGGGAVTESAATPRTVPDAPASLSATPGNAEVTLSWSPPSSDGGSSITKYQYRVSDDGGTTWSPDWTDVPDGTDSGSDQADERSFTVTGLANDTLHTFQVRAVNSVGSGSEAQATATPAATAPGAPASLTASPGDTEAELAWTPPASDGGEAVTKYQYRVSDDGGTTWSPDWTDVPDGTDSGSDQADERSFTVTGLANGTLHTFQVRAVNSVGSGSEAEATATPSQVETVHITIASDHDQIVNRVHVPTFTLTRNGSLDESIDVTVSLNNVAGGDAISGAPKSQTVTFAANDATAEFTPPVFWFSDGGAGGFTVSLEAPDHHTSDEINVTALDVSTAITVSVEQETYEVSESAGSLSFNLKAVTIDDIPAPNQTFDVAVLTSQATATLNDDYTPISIIHTLGNDAWTAENGHHVTLSGPLTIPIVDDSVYEGRTGANEHFLIVIQGAGGLANAVKTINPSGGGSRVEITDDETLSITATLAKTFRECTTTGLSVDQCAPEDLTTSAETGVRDLDVIEDSAGNIWLRVDTGTGTTGAPVTLSDGDKFEIAATPDTDHGATEGADWSVDVKEIAADEKAIITVLDDDSPESNESVQFTVSLPGDSSVAESAATLRILDDERPTPPLLAELTVESGGFDFPVEREDVNTYTATVIGAGTTTVSLTISTLDSTHTYELLDESAQTIADSDTGTGGDQVPMELGPNTITIVVKDGSNELARYTLKINVSAAPSRLSTPTTTTPTDANFTLTVTWAPPSSGTGTVVGYDIRYRTTEHGGAWIEVLTNDLATIRNLTNLIPETEYYVQVRAKNRGAPGLWSPSATGRSSSGDRRFDRTPQIHVDRGARMDPSTNRTHRFKVLLPDNARYRIKARGFTDKHVTVKHLNGTEIESNTGTGTNHAMIEYTSPGRSIYYVEVAKADFILVELATADANTFTPPRRDCVGIGLDHCPTPPPGQYERECRPGGHPNCSVNNGKTGFGSLHTATDVDAWSVIFDYGATYIITVKGAGDQSGNNDNSGTLPDPKLEILELADYDSETDTFTWSLVATSTQQATDNRNIKYTYMVPHFEVQKPWLLRVSSGDQPTGAGTYLISLRKME